MLLHTNAVGRGEGGNKSFNTKTEEKLKTMIIELNQTNAHWDLF